MQMILRSPYSHRHKKISGWLLSPGREHLSLILADVQKIPPKEYFLNAYFGDMLDSRLGPGVKKRTTGGKGRQQTSN